MKETNGHILTKSIRDRQDQGYARHIGHHHQRQHAQHDNDASEGPDRSKRRELPAANANSDSNELIPEHASATTNA